MKALEGAAVAALRSLKPEELRGTVTAAGHNWSVYTHRLPLEARPAARSATVAVRFEDNGAAYALFLRGEPRLEEVAESLRDLLSEDQS